MVNQDGALLVKGGLTALSDLGARLKDLYFNPEENPDFSGHNLIDSHRVSRSVFLVDFQEGMPVE